MKKALVTGGLGFIGHHLAVRLLAEGFQVHVLDNGQRSRVDGEIEKVLINECYKLTLGDLLDDASLDSLGDGYTHVFHLAAIVGVRNVVKQPYSVLTDNVQSLMTMLGWARTQRSLQRFVFPSTSEVYAGTLEEFGMKIPTPESTPLTIADLGRPRTAYMLSKIYGEALCRYSGVPFTIVRPHNIYGPRMGMAHVIPEVLGRAYEAPANGTLHVFSPGHRRSFCYVDDAVELILRIALSPRGLSGTFNIGSAAEDITTIDLARLISETVNKRLSIERGPDTEGSPKHRKPDIDRVVSITAYNPRVRLADGLLRTYQWYRAHVFEPDMAGCSPSA